MEEAFEKQKQTVVQRRLENLLEDVIGYDDYLLQETADDSFIDSLENEALYETLGYYPEDEDERSTLLDLLEDNEGWSNYDLTWHNW